MQNLMSNRNFDLDAAVTAYENGGNDDNADDDDQPKSPVNLVLYRMTAISFDTNLRWFHWTNVCRKLKLYNTGSTVTLKARWLINRPFIYGGPLREPYMFSQVHFHWGRNNLEGSEHCFDGVKFPLEMHVVFFKEPYRTLRNALDQPDGLVQIVYVYDVQHTANENLNFLMAGLQSLKTGAAIESCRLENIPLAKFIPEFDHDYFAYNGRMNCGRNHQNIAIFWLIYRNRLPISNEQINCFRTIRDCNGRPLTDNFRTVSEPRQPVFHIEPHGQQYATQNRDFSSLKN